MGTLRAEIYVDKMPITSANFLDLAKSGFYDGLHIHRVIPGMCVQFGCPFTKDPFSPKAGMGFPTPHGAFFTRDGRKIQRDEKGAFEDEFPLCPRLTNKPGTLAMCNLNAPDTCGSQFFVNVAHNRFLDFFDDQSPAEHPVFGKLNEESFDLVKKMCEEETTPPLDMPINPIKVLSVTIFDPNEPPKDPNNDPKRMGRDGPSAAFKALLADDG